MSPADHIHQTMCVCFYLCVIIVANISIFMKNREHVLYISGQSETTFNLINTKKHVWFLWKLKISWQVKILSEKLISSWSKKNKKYLKKKII